MARKSPAYDVAVILDRHGYGTLGKDIFTGKFSPNKPDAIINVNVYGTFAAPSPNLTYKSPRIQISTRDSIGRNQVCSDRIYEIDLFMHGLQNEIVGETRYAYFLNISEPIDIMEDRNKRPLWVSNYQCLLGGTNNG